MEPAVVFALETSGDICSVAVRLSGEFRSEHTFRHGMHLSEHLMTHVNAVLAEAEAAIEAVGLFAVGIGPGSFTGTRIGVMTVKTFAAVLGRPMVGINGLEAMAAEYAGLAEMLVVPVLPCRSGVVYVCPYEVEAETPRPLSIPAALSLEELAEQIGHLQPVRVLFCGPAAARYQRELREIGAQNGAIVSFGTSLFPRASQIARLAALRVARGEVVDDPISLVPLYVSPPPITAPKQPFPSFTPPEEPETQGDSAGNGETDSDAREELPPCNLPQQ